MRHLSCILVLAAILVGLAASPASARLTLAGHGSTYGNDPVLGIVDGGDSNHPALSGASNDRPGIAVLNSSTLGHWWRVCAPAVVVASRRARDRCRWVLQSDIGPARFTARIVDINAVASRLLWRIPAWRFPTDEGLWHLALYGRELTRRQLRQARWERCASHRCRVKWAPRPAGAA